MSPRFAELLEQLREASYDMIVIDTPPLELVSDALPIGLAATGVIYVCKSATTAIPMVRRSVDRLVSRPTSTCSAWC